MQRVIATGATGLPDAFVKAFRKPGTATAAGFRWWWPHGLVDPVEIAREVDQVADAGFGVLEVGVATRQSYGLAGPVRLVPYVEKVVAG